MTELLNPLYDFILETLYSSFFHHFALRCGQFVILPSHYIQYDTVSDNDIYTRPF